MTRNLNSDRDRESVRRKNPVQIGKKQKGGCQKPEDGIKLDLEEAWNARFFLTNPASESIKRP
ncbi:MAG: hypothetical protein SPE66_04840, partial [Bilifractor sp.]|nr:hypothetical protein [Bilifractor sp.]